MKRYPLLTALSLSLVSLVSAHAAESSLKRFAPSVAALQKLALESSTKNPGDVEAFRTYFQAKDGRKYLFRIEGLLRLYRGTEAPTAKAYVEIVKELEDAVGDHAALEEFIAYAKQVGAEDKVIRTLEGTETDIDANSKIITNRDGQDLKTIRASLNALHSKWFSGKTPYLNTLSQGLSQLSLRTDEELVESFRGEIEKLRGENFDLNELHNGVHEMRRKVRWISIYAEGLGDLFYVSKDDSIDDKSFRTVECTGTPGSAFEIPKAFAYRTSKFLENMGRVKDSYEPIDAVARAYVRAKLVDNLEEGVATVEGLLRAQKKPVPTPFKDAQTIAKDFDLNARLNEWLNIVKK